MRVASAAAVILTAFAYSFFAGTMSVILSFVMGL